MIKPLLPVLLLLAACTSKAPQKTDREEMDLKGFVRSVKTTYYRAVEKDGKVVRGPMNDGISYTVDYFNRKGMLTKTDYFYSSRRKDEAQTEKRIRTFDAAGERPLRDSLWSSYPDIFDGVYVYTYDSDGQLTDKSFFSKTGKRTSRERYGYDDSGNRISRKVYLSGELSASTSSEYDDNGNEVRAITTYYGGLPRKLVQEYRYDEQQRKTDYISHYPGKKQEIHYRFTYNEQGDIVGSEVLKKGDGSGLSEQSNYTYDSRGNWTKRTDFMQKRAVQLIEREIVYF